MRAGPADRRPALGSASVTPARRQRLRRSAGLFRLACQSLNSRRRYSAMLNWMLRWECGRLAGSALRVHEALKARPISSMTEACRTTGLSFPAVSSAMDLLVEKGIARELTGKRRNRLFVYDGYLAILNEGTEPP